MNINKVTTQFIDNVSGKIQQAEEFFSGIVQRIQEIFNKFMSSKTKEFETLETLLLNPKLPIADAFAINEESFNKFATKDRNRIYEKIEHLKKCKPEELDKIKEMLIKKITARPEERTLILNLIDQIDKIQNIFYLTNKTKDLELDGIEDELDGVEPRNEANATNILKDLDLEMSLDIAFDVTEKFVKENAEIGLLNLLKEFEWLANEEPKKLSDLENAISKYKAQNETERKLQIILLAQIDLGKRKTRN